METCVFVLASLGSRKQPDHHRPYSCLSCFGSFELIDDSPPLSIVPGRDSEPSCSTHNRAACERKKDKEKV